MSDPLVIAHRGGAGVWPENTATAFEAAHRAGCVLETDVRHTSDGVAVCFHDATVERFTGEARRVSELTVGALRDRCADAGLPLVTVAELLHAVPDARVVLDVKDPGAVDDLAAVVRRAGAAGRCCATGCFDPALARLRRGVGPELATGLGWWSVAALAAGAPLRHRGGARWAFLPTRLATPRTVNRARSLGLRVAVWTVDEPAAAQRFLALGAEAVTTDRPDRLLPVLHPVRSRGATVGGGLLMRVVMCAETFTPAVNGVVNSVRHVARCLHAAGHEVTVVAPTGDDIPVPGGAIPVVTVPSVSVPGYRSLRIARPGVDLRRVLFDLEPDVVHLASPALLGQAAVEAARVIDRPVAAVFQTDLAAFVARHRAGIPVPARAREGLRARTWRWLREIHDGADVTLAPSRATLEQLRRQGFSRLALWPRGVDAQRFHPAHRDDALGDRLRGGRPLLVGVVARLAAEKRIDLLGPTSRLPGVRVVVVGDGPLRPALQRALPDAVFTGQLEGSELGRVVASLDVLVHPGADETFCQSVQEALAAGVPAVVAASGGPLDLVDDGCNGLLWRGDDPDDLAGLVTRLADPSRRAGLAGAARASVAHRTWEGVTAALLEHYGRIAAERAAASRRVAA